MAGPVVVATEATAVPPVEEVVWTPQAPIENPEVLQAELKSIRQSVVSMTVGQHNTASRILSDWLSSDDPAEPSEGTAGPEEETDAGNGKTDGDEG